MIIEASAPPAAGNVSRSIRSLARALVALTVGLLAAQYVLLGLSGSARLPAAVGFGGSWPLVVFALGFAVVGRIVAVRRPLNPIGWLFATIGALWALGAFASAYAAYVFAAHRGSEGLGRVMLWLQNWCWFPAVALTGTFVVLLFPDGRLLSPRWRPVAWTAAVGIVVGTLATAFAPGHVENFDRNNPFALGGTAWSVLFAVSIPALVGVVVSIIAAVVSLIVRFRRSRRERRQQLKWFAYGAAIVGVSFPAAFILYGVAREEVEIAMAVGIAALPICAGIAILRYRLYEIDQLINRTLVYGGLTAMLVGLYAGTLELLSLAVHRRTSFWPAAAATAVVIVLAQPLRSRLQRHVNRLLYGDRDEPYAAISRLARRLETTLAPDAMLGAVVESIAQALRVPYVAIAIERDGSPQTAASHGVRPPGEPATMSLKYQGETVGALLVAVRAPGETFDARESRLLEDLARQTGVAVHSVRLTNELQRSRERLVTAREEERRRIRRDLHDGLGPTLAAITLNLDSARGLIQADPAAAEALLLRLREEAQAAIADIRRLVYELRPPALDELGLAAALREQAVQLSSQGANGLAVSVEAPNELPPLAAAVEVAAYRIALEALTNAARHARAQTCTVRIAVDGALELAITDDGKGIAPGARAGVGIGSMQERAAELGGTCTVESAPGGGTAVRASLPLTRA